MSGESLVKRHPVDTYVVLAFGISWGGALLAIGSGGGMRGTTPASDPRFAYALVAMVAGPSVVGVLMTWPRLHDVKEGAEMPDRLGGVARRGHGVALPLRARLL